MINTSLFTLDDVTGDGMCFYRAVINGLIWRSNSGFLKPDKLLTQRYYNTKNNYSNIQHLCTDNYQDMVLPILLSKIKKWVMRNKHAVIDMSITLADAVYLTHDISIKEYVTDHLTIDNTLDAGFAEQHIISNMFNVPIVILRAYTISKDSNMKYTEGVIKNGKPNKNVVFKVIQVINPGKKIGLPIYLLWKKYGKNDYHYMSCYLKNVDSDEIAIINKLDD